MIVTVQSGSATGVYQDVQRGKIAALLPTATIYRVPDTASIRSIMGDSSADPVVPPMTEAQVQAIEEALTPAEMLSRITGMSIADIQTALGI